MLKTFQINPPPYQPVEKATLLQVYSSIAVDADLGPFPKVHDVVLNTGNRTWDVIFEVSTLIKSCGQNKPPPDVINSHRWTMTHDIDSEGLCSRTIVGHIFFRTDRLLQYNQDAQQLLGTGVPTIQPDQFRGWFIHPPFQNSRRDILRCAPNADGDEIDYTIRDVELPINLYAKGATRVELVHSVEADDKGGEAAIGGIGNALVKTLKAIGNAAEAAAAASAGSVAGATIAAGSGIDKIIEGAISAVGGSLSLTGRLSEFVATEILPEGTIGSGALRRAGRLQRVAAGDIPTITIAAACRVWGRRDTTRYNLMTIGWQLCMARLALSVNGLTNQQNFCGESFDQLINIGVRILAGRKVRIEHDAAGKFVTVTMSLVTQVLGINVLSRFGIQTAPNNFATGYSSTQNLTMPAIYNAFPFLEQPFRGIGPARGTPADPWPTSDETVTELPLGDNPLPPQGLNTLNTGPQLGVGFLNDNGTRGSHLGLAVAQQLLAPCFPSTQPIDPPIIDPLQVKGAPTNDPTNPYKSWSPFPPSTLAPPPPPPKPPGS
jgi:hypothetical protein